MAADNGGGTLEDNCSVDTEAGVANPLSLSLSLSSVCSAVLYVGFIKD